MKTYDNFLPTLQKIFQPFIIFDLNFTIFLFNKTNKKSFQAYKIPERCKIAKTLLWTELGHKWEQFRLIGSKKGLSGQLKRFFIGYFQSQKPLHTGDLTKKNQIRRTDTLR